jgi:methionyl-tRNA formyltransferase
MRLAFMGSPDFAVPALHSLHAAGHTIATVYCQPPRPAGRGHMIHRCPVHVAADALGLPVRTPTRLRNNIAEHAEFAALRLDAAVVAAYGLILPQALLSAPARGCLNIHASLLPRWRGAAPIQAAVLAGDAETGITIMQMDAGLDTGPMLLREAVPIAKDATSASLHDVLAELGARLIVQALAEPRPPVAQCSAEATYATKLERADGRFDWTQDAVNLERMVRAFDPWPGTFTTLSGTNLKILAARLAEGIGPPGTVLDDALTVACGHGALRLTRIQMPGRGALDAAAFLRGHPVVAGTVLGESVAGKSVSGG